MPPPSPQSLATGLALGRDRTLYVSEHANNRIRRVDANGVIHAFAGAGPAVLNGGTFGGDGRPAAKAAFNVPTTIAFDSTGNLYVTDRDNDRVRRIDPSGTITTVAGNGTRGYSGDGGPATSAELSGPDGIAIDADGNLFVCDDGNWRIRRIGRDGVITTVAGTGRQATTGDGGAATQASLTDSAGLAFDRHGNLFISDFSANRIRKIDTRGVIATIAGKRSPADGGFAGDGGSATAAQLRNPRGIVVDAAGNVYFSDGGNHRVRRIDTHGVITTVFGPTT